MGRRTRYGEGGLLRWFWRWCGTRVEAMGVVAHREPVDLIRLGVVVPLRTTIFTCSYQ